MERGCFNWAFFVLVGSLCFSVFLAGSLWFFVVLVCYGGSWNFLLVLDNF